MPRSLQELKIAFDPGASLTKCVYTLNGGNAQLLTMEPDVIGLPLDSVSQIKTGTARPEDQAWVKLDHEKTQVQVCGRLAQQFSTVERIDLLKYEHALYKLLAVIGAIISPQETHKFTVQASLVLPYGEINSRDQLQKNLTKEIRSFYFQGKQLRGQLKKFNCLVEGSGVIAQLVHVNGKDWFQAHRVVMLIMGYRNLSLLTFSGGVLEVAHTKTSNLGFVDLIERVVARTSGQDRKTLTEAVYKIGLEINSKNPALRGLVKSTQPSNIEAEIKSLVEAITLARSEYWTSVRLWLNLVLPKKLNRFAISGGTALYLKPEIDQHLGWADPNWIFSQSGRLELAEASTQFRFADVMNLFEHTLTGQEIAA